MSGYITRYEKIQNEFEALAKENQILKQQLAEREKECEKLIEQLKQAQEKIRMSCANQAYFLDDGFVLHVRAIPTEYGLVIDAYKNSLILQQISQMEACKIQALNETNKEE